MFHEGPLRSDELREALEALFGCDEGAWAAAMRTAVLLGETARERSELLTAFRALLDGDGPGARAEDAVGARSSRHCSTPTGWSSSSRSTSRFSG